MRDDLLTAPPCKQPKDYSSSFISMASVEEKPVEWLIDGYLPRGAITVLSADGGSGKTFCLCDIIAGLTTGNATVFEADRLEELERKPGNVLFFSGEDSLSHVLKKRLREAGAEMSRVYTVSPSDELFPEICFGSEALEWAIREYKPLLAAFDPLQAFVQPGTELSSRAEMRSQFKSLLALAERHGTAFLILCHTNKKQNADGRNRAADSSDLWDVSRSFLMSGRTEDGFRFSQEKSSYSELQPTILARIERGKLVFAGTTDKRDREFMAERPNASRNSGYSVARAKEFIIDYLSSVERATGRELTDACLQDGMSRHTVDRARGELNKLKLILKAHESKPGGGVQVYWQLNRDAQIPWQS